MKVLRPFFSFYGAKWRAAAHYPAPEHPVIVEPFAGSAGYSLRYYARRIVLVDRDPLIAALWRYLIRVRASEIRSLPDIKADQTVDDLGVCEEARWLIGFWSNQGSSYPHKRPSTWAREYPEKFWGEARRERVASQVEHIRHWSVIEGDYSSAPDARATWFVDPPYEKAGTHYKHSSKAIDFEHLGEWCRRRRGQVIVCENVGAEWLPFEPWRDILSGGQGTRRSNKSAEAIWYRRDVDVWAGRESSWRG